MIEKMLVPVDGSSPSQKALELACDLASRFDAAGRPVLDAAEAMAESRGVRVAHAGVLSGSPAKMILEAAERHGSDTIVMGSRGLSDIAGLLLGSVSHKVSHLAPCTCIVVR